MFFLDAENPEGVDSYCHKMNGEWKRKHLQGAHYVPNTFRPQIPTVALPFVLDYNPSIPQQTPLV